MGDHQWKRDIEIWLLVEGELSSGIGWSAPGEYSASFFLLTEAGNPSGLNQKVRIHLSVEVETLNKGVK